MTDIAQQTQELIRSMISSAAAQAVKKGSLPEGTLPEFIVEIPADRKNGDYSTNAAMAGARAFHCAPAKIADALIENMPLDGTCFEKVEKAGPGFINFTLGPAYYASVIEQVLKQGGDYGRSDIGRGKRVLVEFVSANPTGPMHIGNARGGALGDTLAELLSRAGFYTEREFYINDAGNQIEKFGMSLSLRYQELFKSGIEIPEDAYHGADIVEHAKNYAAEHGDSLMSVPEEQRRKALTDYALPLNIAGLKRDLQSYRIEYDTWFPESSLHKSGAVGAVLDKLRESGKTYESDGALWFRATDYGCDKDFVLIRSNGLPTYIVPDIAYHYNKLVTRGFDIAVDVLGADHHGYVPRMKASLSALGVDPERLKVVIMQMVNLVRDGETVKLSKRSGKAITLVTLLEEVPLDSARFFFNMRDADTHCDFDLDLAVKEDSDNPVYYCQYAHARVCSILRMNEKNGGRYEPATFEQLCRLTQPEEKELIRHIGSLRHIIEVSAEALEPSGVTRYATELAALFHKFYNACRVETDDADLHAARLTLCVTVGDIMKSLLEMLKVSVPDRM